MSKTGRERWGGITHYAIDSHDFTENDAGGGVGGARSARVSRANNILADLMRFLVRIRGARTPPPMMDEPVTKIPLK